MMTNLMPYRSNLLSRNDRDDGWFMSDFFRPFFGSEMWNQNAFRVDVKDNGDSYLLEAELPGAKKDDVHIDVEDGMLTISAQLNNHSKEERDGYIMTERRSGSFSRSFSLDNIREEEISAEYVDGVLKLTLPKQQEETRQPRRIEIQ